MARTVAGLFADRRAAQRTIVDLEAAGFDSTRITLSHRSLRPAFSALRIRTISSTTGAVIGAILLGIAGALIGWAADVATSGPRGSDFLVFIAITLVGGMVGWLVGGLLLASVPTEESPYLRQRYEDSSVVLRVNASGREAIARHILARNGGKDPTSNRRRFPIPARHQPRAPLRGGTPAA